MSRFFYVDSPHPYDDWAATTEHLVGTIADDDIVVLRSAKGHWEPTYFVWPNSVPPSRQVIVELWRSQRHADVMEHFAAAVKLADEGKLDLRICVNPSDRGFCARFGECRYSWPFVRVHWWNETAVRRRRLDCLLCPSQLRSCTVAALVSVPDEANAYADTSVASHLESKLLKCLAVPVREALFVVEKARVDNRRFFTPTVDGIVCCVNGQRIEARAGQRVYCVSLEHRTLSECEEMIGAPSVAVGEDDFEFVRTTADNKLLYRMSAVAYFREQRRYETLLVLAMSWPDVAPYALLEIVDWFDGIRVCPHRRKIALLQGVQRSVRRIRRSDDQIESEPSE